MSRVRLEQLLAVSPARRPAVVARAHELDAEAHGFEREAQRARVEGREGAAAGFEARARDARREASRLVGGGG